MGVVFFFKQKTAYEMRISDWSSDVCSSDLVQHAAVLGAGIMGGGISYQSASKGVPVIMKDIADKALDLGMEEANKLLSKQVGKKLTAEKAGHILSTIRPTLNYGDFQTIHIFVEAVEIGRASCRARVWQYF